MHMIPPLVSAKREVSSGLCLCPSISSREALSATVSCYLTMAYEDTRAPLSQQDISQMIEEETVCESTRHGRSYHRIVENPSFFPIMDQSDKGHTLHQLLKHHIFGSTSSLIASGCGITLAGIPALIPSNLIHAAFDV